MKVLGHSLVHPRRSLVRSLRPARLFTLNTHSLAPGSVYVKTTTSSKVRGRHNFTHFWPRNCLVSAPDFSWHPVLPKGITDSSVGDPLATRGDLMAIYPGTFYIPGEPLFWASLGNPYIFRCADGLLLDANYRGEDGF